MSNTMRDFSRVNAFRWTSSVKRGYTYNNRVNSQGSAFRRKAKAEAYERVCPSCHIVHAVLQRECE